MNKPDPAEVFSLDRRAVAQAFDRASASYDAAAALQERVRNELMERLVELKLAPLHILDLGAGTGHATARAEAPLSIVARGRGRYRARHAGACQGAIALAAAIRARTRRRLLAAISRQAHSTWSSAA